MVIAQPLETADLLLEPLLVEHADEMALLLDDLQLHTYTGGRPDTLEELRERYRRQVVGRSADGSQLWFNWVLRHRPSCRAVGFVQATVGVAVRPPTAEIAWVVASADQGQGLARQAAGAVVNWLRGRGVARVIAHVHPEHRASMVVAAAIGMRPTETVVDGEVQWAL